MARGPYCFIIMPIGLHRDPLGGPDIDFDYVYTQAIAPGVEDAGLHAHRDDHHVIGGVMQRQIFEALILCDYAVVDLTAEVPNVYYELGIRHAVRPLSTLTTTARAENIPFDVAYLRSLRYDLDERNRLTDEAASALRRRVAEQLAALRVSKGPWVSDSPLFQLIDGWRPPLPESLKTDLFATRVAYNESIKQRLGEIRAQARRGEAGLAKANTNLQLLRDSLSPLEDVDDAGVFVDLMLAYRALEDWGGMIEFIHALPGMIFERPTVQEQLAFALNRRADTGDEDDRDLALDVMRRLDQRRRGGSESFGLLGRIYKSKWRGSPESHDRLDALDEAIDAYRKGFYIDSSDPYPGVNLVSLMFVKGDEASLLEVNRLLPIVEFAIERLDARDEPTYWLEASKLEVAVMRGQRELATVFAARARRRMRERWELKTTAANLRDLAAALHRRGVDDSWIASLILDLCGDDV